MHLGLIRTLLELTRGERTGVLEVKTEEARTRLYLSNGNIVFADEGTVGETLGRILTREKVLDGSDYERVLEAMAKAREAGEPARFGEVVVKLGVLTQSQVDAALAAQVQHKLLNCLKWPEATFQFVSKDALSPEIARFPTEIEPVLIRAMRVMSEDAKRDVLEDKLGARATLTTDLGRITSLFRLKTPEVRFARMIDGTKTVAELLEASHPDAVDPELLLCVLSLTGHMSCEAAAPATVGQEKRSMPPKRRKTEVTAKRSRRKSALRSMVVRLSDRERRRIKAAAQRLKTRTSDQPRSFTPAHMNRVAVATDHGARLVAEQHFRRGRHLLRQNKLSDALVALKRAVDLVPSAGEYRLYAAWASFRSLPEKEAERMSGLRAIARRAIKEDSELGFAYYVLGHIAAREGNAEEAEELLDRARKLDPETIDEEKPLRIAPARPTQKVVVPKMPPRSTPDMPKMRALSPPFSVREVEESEPSSDKISEHDKVTIAPGSSDSEVPKKAVLATTTPAPAATIKMAEPTTAAPKAPALATDKPVAKSRPATSAPQSKPRSALTFVIVAALVAVGIFAIAARERISASFAGQPTATSTPSTPIPASASAQLPLSASTTSALASARPPASAPASAVASASAAPRATSSASATANAVAPASASAQVSAPASAQASTSPPASASPLASASPVSPAGSGTGAIIPPSWAQGRRVFVDGKVAGEAPNPIDVPCGSHVVQVGSAGKPKTVDVPCGGKVEL